MNNLETHPDSGALEEEDGEGEELEEDLRLLIQLIQHLHQNFMTQQLNLIQIVIFLKKIVQITKNTNLFLCSV